MVINCTQQNAQTDHIDTAGCCDDGGLSGES